MSKKASAILLSAGIVLLGFLRGYLFDNINWVYLTLTNGRMNSARDEFMFLVEWTPAEINTLKWILTIIFTILFFLLTLWTVKVYFNKKSFNQIVIFLFVALFCIAGFLFVVGKISGYSDMLYGPIRTIMGMVQSFIPLMILFVLFKFLPQIKSD
ncbi:MAG: hypothetical protein GQ574_16320 [Crocinitomix sp.]|nr:hypothetical protein [Crocinitomix sp.]